MRGDIALNLQHLSSQKLKNQYRDAFVSAKPFRHLMLDGLFSEAVLDGILDEFRDVSWDDWVRYDNANERKRGMRPNTQLGPASQAYVNAIHSGLFVDFLTYVTRINGLLPDPTLKGGGLHEIPQGGKFAVHIDFTKHPVTRLDNRLVLITYLNRGWQPSYGGALELWSAGRGQRVVEVQSIFGRSILFDQSPQSWNGHPNPVSAPAGRTRRSIAAYYYTNGRNDMASTVDHSTIFIRPMMRTRRDKMTAVLRSVTPPILIDAGKRLIRR
jgi:hypothetical protein